LPWFYSFIHHCELLGEAVFSFKLQMASPLRGLQ
jgi:hypothetical protein